MRFTHIAFVLALLPWVYRLLSLNNIIQTGFLADFRGYYEAAQTVVIGNPDPTLILKSTFGPPFVIIPYLPFALFPFQAAEYLLTLLNIASYFLVFYLLWKKFFGSLTWFFWLYLGSLAFSFPLVFSLSMGNAIGFVTLGVYAFWIFKNRLLQGLSFSTSVLLKIFPIVLIFPLRNRKTMLIFLAVFLSISFAILPTDIWSLYQSSTQKIITAAKPDAAIYNQSFSSTLARFGFSIHSFSPLYLVFATLISLISLLAFWRKKQYKEGANDLDIGLLFLTAALLLHPFPWQYNFAVLLPFLMIKMKHKNLIYFAVFLLMSLNGDRLPIGGLIKATLSSSQFFGAFLLFVVASATTIFRGSKMNESSS